MENNHISSGSDTLFVNWASGFSLIVIYSIDQIWKL